MKRECQGEKINWRGYINMVRKTGRFEDIMFGTWLTEPEEPPKATGSTTASTAQKGTDLRSYLSNPNALKKALADYLDRKRPQSLDRRHHSQGQRGRQGRSRTPDRRNDRRNRDDRSRSPRRQDYRKRGNARYNQRDHRAKK